MKRQPPQQTGLSSIPVKKLSSYFLVLLASFQFMVYIILMILEHETPKIMIMGSLNILASFFGSLFIIFTLVKNLKNLHRKSYMALGVLSFLFRGICLFGLSFYYKSPREDFFITNETDSTLLYTNFIWMGCYIAMFHLRPKHQNQERMISGRMMSDFS